MSDIDLCKDEDTICILCDLDSETCGETPYLDEAIDDIVCRKFKLTQIKTQKKRIEDTVERIDK